MFGETSNAFTRNIQKFYTVCKFITSPSGRAQSVHFFTFNTAICNARLLFLLQNYDGCRRLKQKKMVQLLVNLVQCSIFLHTCNKNTRRRP